MVVVAVLVALILAVVSLVAMVDYFDTCHLIKLN